MRTRLSTLVPGAALLLALLVPAPVPAQTSSLSVSVSGDVLGCSDPSLNGPVDFSFTLSASTSGNYTTVRVDFGGSLGSFEVMVPSSDIQALSSALASAGGSIEISLNELLGPPGCSFLGTLSITLAGGDQVGPNAPGNLATTGAVIEAFARTSLPAISNRIRSVFRGFTSGLQTAGNTYTVSGMAAGSGERAPIGAWAGYSYTDTENDFVSTAFDSRRHTALFGLDVMPRDDVLLGVSVSLERSDVDTRFNGGEQGITAISFAPYVGFLLTDWLTVDAAAGVGSVQTDQFRTAGGARITSDVESLRVFANVNATGTWAFGPLLASGRAGLLYVTQEDDRFTESNGVVIGDTRSRLGRFLLGGELAYAAGAWEPYLGATFEHDFSRDRVSFAPGVAQPRSDASDVLFAAGVRYYGRDDVSGSIEYSSVLGRRNLDEHTVSANVRWTF